MLLSGRVLALYTQGYTWLWSPMHQKQNRVEITRSWRPEKRVSSRTESNTKAGNSVCHAQRLTPALTFSGVFSQESRSVNEG